MMHCAPLKEENSNMAAVQTTNPMYKVPVFFNDSSQVDLPSCMYHMRSYHIEQVSEGSGANEKREDILMLENKQESILKDLERLKSEIFGLAEKLGVKLPEKRCPVSVDHVISASPQDPPLSLFVLQDIMNKRSLVHSTFAFVHSSVADSDVNKVPVFQKSRNDQGRQSPCLLTIVWKNVPDLPVLVMSSNHTPLMGEFTIARHLCRAFLPDLYSRLGVDGIAHVDQWISFASTSLLNSRHKERVTALHTLNSYLENKKWLVGNQISLADIAVASAIVKTGSLQTTFANVKKWLENFQVLQ